MTDDYNISDEAQKEEKMVDDAFHHLIESYLATKHRKKVEIITKAFNFARHAHRGVRRLSGEPYIMHPLAVAQIVCEEIGLGSTSICCALLHDVVEDTDYTVEDIENMFGPKIAQIVDGLTKIAGGIFGENASAQAENFKKLLLTMSEDIRVILIKIADRLHNMRTLGSQAKNKQYKIAGETLYIYAPLAHRLGLNTIKSELENLSFRYEHPREYQEIVDKLALTEAARKTVFDDFTAPIRRRLDAMGIHYQIKARIKTPYSIWHKMQTKHVPFEEVYDILAVRIVFEPTDAATEAQECFNIYVAMSQIYRSHPDRLRDWVNHPKANGYQALHVTLMSARGEWIEVQIRSLRMDDIAEKGFAAHWKYKDGATTDEEKESELDKWLTTIKEILDDPQPDAMDFLDTIKLNLFASEIFVFTPKGELRTMPAGATALDFAFTIHTFVGSHCIGAKVNHRLVSMSHQLKSGDQVEILTSKTQHVTRAWLNMATTAKAKTKILGILRREEREIRRKGEDMLDQFLEKNEVTRDTPSIERLCRNHQFTKPDELFYAIGSGSLQLDQHDVDVVLDREPAKSTTWRRFFKFGRKSKKGDADMSATPAVAEPIDRKKAIILDDQSIQHRYTLSECCKPIPGDPVMGYIDDGGQIVVHKLQCPIAMRLKANHGNRVLAARWNMQQRSLLFPVNINLQGIDRIGLLNEMTQIISQQHSINMHRLLVEAGDGIFTCDIQLFVHDTSEVDDLIQGLSSIKDIKSVARI
ncbi:MAG: bifunctional (p)ppGpp synthetase/guanosine-3',5'-bis(diphosphate) 3'-pyrophosphohydrolase [Bacteroidaceae bacterium]|nr:bifunctional (p)ppGpp synthetase/guanosine-3',5'-bis(diphosphate) 3'-pyrophosphohydrolase [Bacteroidaceae bacterium]